MKSFKFFLCVLLMKSYLLVSNENQKTYKMGITCFPVQSIIRGEIEANLDLSKIKNIPEDKYFESLCRIPTTYMKFLESKNIKFIPIFLNEYSNKIYLEQLDYLDGIVMTGGTITGIYLNKGKTDYETFEERPDSYSNYLNFTKDVLDKAKKINDSGRVFVVYGVCQSFYSIVEIESGRDLYLSKIYNNVFNRPIYFNYYGNYNDGSGLKKFIGDDNISKFENGNNAFFFHNFGISLGEFVIKQSLIENYYPVAIYKIDPEKKPYEFVGAIENKKYPIFALQFHPEKILYETSSSMHISQNQDNLSLSKLFVDYIYKKLESGARGAEIPNDILRKFSCPRFLMKDAGIFSSAYIYDCKNLIKPLLKNELIVNQDY